jgi:phosphatidate cytidylyltransferase
MLGRRLISAAVLISIALGLLWLDLNDSVRGQAGLWTVPLLVVFGLGTVWEFSSLVNKRWSTSPAIVTWHAFLSYVVVLYPLWYSMVLQRDYPADCPIGRLGWVWIGALTGVGLSGCHALRQFSLGPKDPADEVAQNQYRERTTLDWMMSSLIIVYVVGGLSVWHVIRMRGPSSGLYEVIALMSITKFSDAGAYFSGKLFGRTKLIPAISPGKTLEGLLGGIVFAIVIAYLAMRWVLPQLGVAPGPYWWGPAVMGVLLTIVGLVGDLLESMIKRSVGAKDSGKSIPGLGGVWDVTDSLIPTAIVGYLGLIAKL